MIIKGYKMFTDKELEYQRLYQEKVNAKKKAIRLTYSKEYYIKNKDKMKEYRKKYQLETKNSNKEWRLTIEERKEHKRLYNKKYYENQKKRILGNIV